MRNICRLDLAEKLISRKHFANEFSLLEVFHQFSRLVQLYIKIFQRETLKIHEHFYARLLQILKNAVFSMKRNWKFFWSHLLSGARGLNSMLRCLRSSVINASQRKSKHDFRWIFIWSRWKCYKVEREYLWITERRRQNVGVYDAFKIKSNWMLFLINSNVFCQSATCESSMNYCN